MDGHMANTSTISVLGAGYVGLTTAAILANCGYKVYLLEPDETKLQVIKTGKSFFYEAGLDNLIAPAIENQSLIPLNNYEEAVPHSQFVFSCVGTPDNPDGSSNLSYVFAAAAESLKHLAKDAVYVQKSTVPVGTGARIQDMAKRQKITLRYVSNPEFLREGTAIADTLWFDRIVCGSTDAEAADAVLNIYRQIEQKRNKVADTAKVSPPEKTAPGKYILTSRNSAELIKVTANAFLALKISFANSIAKLADHAGADINDIMDGVGADERIGRAFLNAGRGYGGGCFPKDVSGLISSASDYSVDMHIMTAVSDLNESMPGYIATKVKGILGGLDKKRVAVLGLAFKAGTSDARRSPAVTLANLMAKDGASVSAFDPHATEEASHDLRKEIRICASVTEAIHKADAIFVATDWPQFLKLDLAKVKHLMRGNTFVDCMNRYDISRVEKAGLQYIGIGRNGSKQ
jgi:UDPglucose 6-dehydrogenase